MTDLMRYLPDYYGNFKEMGYITNAENPEIDLLWDSVAKVRLNQFIADADDATIRKWEKLLNIMPDYSLQALETRKAIVLMRLQTRAPLTLRWLQVYLDNAVGAGNYTINLDHNAYTIDIDVQLEILELFAAIDERLSKIIPANLALFVRYLSETRVETAVYTGVIAHQYTKETHVMGLDRQYLYTGIYTREITKETHKMKEGE